MRSTNAMALSLLAFLLLITTFSLSEDLPTDSQSNKMEPNAAAAPNLINSSLEPQVKEVVEEAGESELVKILKERLQKQDDQIERSGTSKSDTLAIIAIVIAALATGSAIYSTLMNYKTRKLLKPMERPALDLQKTTVIASQSEGLTITITNIFKNVGKHPASKIGFKTICATIDKDSTKLETTTKRTFRRLYPDAMHNWTSTIKLSIKHDHVNEIIIKIHCVYEDMLEPNHEPYEDDFYLILDKRTSKTYYATLEQVEKYKPLLNSPKAP